MTANIPKPSRTRFKADLEEYEALRLALDLHNDKDEPHVLDSLFERCQIAEEKVLGQRAPSLDALASKLMILWEDDIWLDTVEATQMQIIVGDLRQFARTMR